MIKNPDPKKYKIKKLRKGDYILVDKQILNWRKRGDSKVLALESLVKRTLLKENASKEDLSYVNLFGDDE